MVDRRGVLMVIYDLPTVELADKRAHAAFRRQLLRDGDMALQESVYVKLVRNISSEKDERRWLNEVAPTKGQVSLLPLSLNQFKQLAPIRGEGFDMSLFSDDMVWL